MSVTIFWCCRKCSGKNGFNLELPDDPLNVRTTPISDHQSAKPPEAIKDELAAGARADLDAMATAMGKARECPAQAEEAFADILRRAADIKGQAVNFENPILGAAAASLTTYLEKAGSQADKKADVVEAHLQAMQLVMADESARTKDGEELLNALRELVARTLGH